MTAPTDKITTCERKDLNSTAVLAVNDDHGQIVGTSYACAACATGMTLSAERDDVVRPGGHRPDLNGRLRLASCRCRWLYRDALGSLRAAALTMIINKA